MLMQSRLDWDAIDDELYHIPNEFKDPKFDSLKHVLSILGANDSDASMQEVRPSNNNPCCTFSPMCSFLPSLKNLLCFCSASKFQVVV